MHSLFRSAFRGACFCAFLVASTMNISAQDERLDELPFEEEPLIEETTKPYGALAGGYIFVPHFMNLDPLNEKFGQIGLGELKGPMFIQGGQGFTVLPWIPNFRFGLMGMGGSLETGTTGEDIVSEAEYSVGFTALTVDYGWVVMKSLAILPGIALGYGDQNITIYNSQNIEWDNITRTPLTGQGAQTFTQDLILVQPQINIEWAFTDLFMLRVGASYNINFALEDTWVYNKTSTASGIPGDINGNGFAIQLGLFAGLFNY